MKTLILTSVFLIIMLIEIAYDYFNFKDKKKLVHLLQIVLLATCIYSGWFLHSYFHTLNIYYLLLGVTLTRLALFNPILNFIMGWPMNYKGKTDYFDVIRLWFEARLLLFLKNRNKLLADVIFVTYGIISLSFYPAFMFISIISFYKSIYLL